MKEPRIPKPGEIYKHFKDKHYQIITIATHSENRELMVVYQALYGDFKTYVRPLEMFISEVDHMKYPDVTQKYRFELQSSFEDILYGNEKRIEESVKLEKLSEVEKVAVEAAKDKAKSDLETTLDQAKQNFNQLGVDGNKAVQEAVPVDNSQDVDPASQNHIEAETDGNVNSILMEFLDQTSYSKKLEVLLFHKKHMNDRLVNDMAVALDIAVDEGPLETRIQGLINCLSAMSRFEHRRLR
jgi:hypothetical protein